MNSITPTHIFVKYDKERNGHNTIEEHKNIINEEGEVHWQSGAVISAENINMIETQIKNNIPTYLFMKENGTVKTYYRGLIKQILKQPGQISKAPKYIRDMGESYLFIVLGSIDELDVIEDNYLSNQAAITYVQEKQDVIVSVWYHLGNAEKDRYFKYKPLGPGINALKNNAVKGHFSGHHTKTNKRYGINEIKEALNISIDKRRKNINRKNVEALKNMFKL